MQLLSLLHEASSLAIDSADLKDIEAFSSLINDVTINPTLLWKAANTPAATPLLRRAYNFALKDKTLAADYFLVLWAGEILSRIPGELSLEIDPRLSFDTNGTLSKALHIARHMQDLGIPRSRYLIKIAGTWEGIEAVKELQQLGVRCNVTVILSIEQAIAAHNAGASMIACYVARVKDWYDAHQLPYTTHPGAQLVKNIFEHLARIGSKTKVMAASFRKIEDLFALSYGPILTISPQLLTLLKNEMQDTLPEKGIEAILGNYPDTFTEESFRKALENNPMALEKLKEAIHLFSEDTTKLEMMF